MRICAMMTRAWSPPSCNGSIPMRDSEARVALVVRGVVEQALRDAGTPHLQLQSADSAQSRLIARWCAVTFDQAAGALTVGVQTKTELLLGGSFESADL